MQIILPKHPDQMTAGGFTGYSLEAGSVGYAMLFSVFAAISGFLGLTAVNQSYKIRPTLNKQTKGYKK